MLELLAILPFIDEVKLLAAVVLGVLCSSILVLVCICNEAFLVLDDGVSKMFVTFCDNLRLVMFWAD